MKKYLFPLLILSTAGCGRLQAQTAAQAVQEPARARAQAQTAPRAQAQTQTQTAAQAQAQSHPFHRWSIDVLAGPAIPLGKFASLDHQNPGGGPIHTGGLAELSGAYHLNRSFAIVLLTNAQQNKGNGIAYTQPPPEPLFDPIYIGFPLFTYGSQHWKIARALTGAEYTLPLNKRKSLDLLVRLLGGVQKTKPADYNLYIGATGERLSSPYVHLPWSFSYQFDAGLKWQQQGRIALIAYAGYNGSQPSKDLTYASVAPQQAYTLYKVHTKFPTGSLLVRAGIEIEL